MIPNRQPPPWSSFSKGILGRLGPQNHHLRRHLRGASRPRSETRRARLRPARERERGRCSRLGADLGKSLRLLDDLVLKSRRQLLILVELHAEAPLALGHAPEVV